MEVGDYRGSTVHFGTDGWRARIDEAFTDDNVVRVADAIGSVWEEASRGAIVYVGYDTREGAARFARLVGEVLSARGLCAFVSDVACPAPALSWAVAHDMRACGGIMLTASHNPEEYQGIKIRMPDGGAAPKEFTDEVELRMAAEPTSRRGSISFRDIVTPYLEGLAAAVDADAISRAGLKVVHDPMYGSARGCLARVLRGMGVEVHEIHADDVEGFCGLHPEPVEPWVDECEQAVLAEGAAAGLVNDGAGARFGLVDERGRLVGPHVVLSLVLGHLVRNRGMSGRVVVTASTSAMALALADLLGCQASVVPVGFKWVYAEMKRGDVLLGGEESGGIGVPAHMLERDGLLTALLLCELMAMSGKGIAQLVDELEQAVGRMCYVRRDLRMPVELIEMLKNLLPGMNPPELAGRVPVEVSHKDGLRMMFEDGSWAMIRPSGTEPLVRVYAEAGDVQSRDDILEAAVELARAPFGASGE